ncbi:DUF6588 family protein [Fulvivirga sediminis]|uniref:Outer membrane protein beta-barrel domain-containing protein n=1 Tax=Fulvivirga sediminis TaxID=2803949 RepID=A0A937F670_9BACT|nr:DUF6588 family protein [Fulvivirga sediminis]MBL3656480.1 hypothetical protein [Fulvivirga sediminis]
MRKVYIIILLSVFMPLLASAQDDLSNLIQAGTENANALAEGYVQPFMKGFGTGLGSGWLNTAKAHKTLGFDLTVTVNGAFVPDKDLSYNPSRVGQNSSLTLLSPDAAPTMFGRDEEPRYAYSYTHEGRTFSGEFDGPASVIDIKNDMPMSVVPVPMAQLGIGIIKNTDIKIRWTPEVDVEDGSFKLIGFGVMHDIKQHIPGIKNLPFDLSAFVGYTSVSFDIPFDEEVNTTGGGVYTNNGLGQLDVNTLTGQATISKKISVLTVYGGVGFNRVRSKIKLKGDYVVRDDFGNSESVSNPIDLSFKEGGVKLNAGFRLKLAIVTLHADYTVQQYDVLSVGFGFAVR